MIARHPPVPRFTRELRQREDRGCPRMPPGYSRDVHDALVDAEISCAGFVSSRPQDDAGAAWPAEETDSQTSRPARPPERTSP